MVVLSNDKTKLHITDGDTVLTTQPVCKVLFFMP